MPPRQKPSRQSSESGKLGGHAFASQIIVAGVTMSCRNGESAVFGARSNYLGHEEVGSKGKPGTLENSADIRP